MASKPNPQNAPATEADNTKSKSELVNVKVLTVIDGGYMPGDIVQLDKAIAEHYIAEKAVEKSALPK